MNFAIYNDTVFLSRLRIIDYSLLLIIIIINTKSHMTSSKASKFVRLSCAEPCEHVIDRTHDVDLIDCWVHPWSWNTWLCLREIHSKDWMYLNVAVVLGAAPVAARWSNLQRAK